jgi:hypothetical protein
MVGVAKDMINSLLVEVVCHMMQGPTLTEAMLVLPYIFCISPGS